MKLNSLWKSPDLLGYEYRPALTDHAQHKQRTQLACTLSKYACIKGVSMEGAGGGGRHLPSLS